MKNLFLSGLMALCASAAYAQTTGDVITTTTYSSPQIIKVGTSCTISGVTSLAYDYAAGTITTNGSGSCNGSTTPPATVTLSISPATYVLGSAAAAPVISYVNTTPAAPVTCTLTPTNGFTATASGTSFTLSTPTTAGTFSFQPSCTAAGYSVSVVPAAVSLSVTSNSPPPGQCSPSTSTTLGTKTFTRQCTGSVAFNSDYLSDYTGPLSDLGTVLGGASFPNYLSGYTPTFTVTSGQFVALQFTAAASGSIQLVANSSFGDGGLISLSSASSPGALLAGNPGVICAFARGGANSMYVSTSATTCQVVVGQQYFINIADADSAGNQLCSGGRANTCSTSKIAYTLYTSGK